MKSKIIHSTIDKQSGVTSVIIQNRFGQFTGWSECHPDDMEDFSAFAGERYAEIRANQKYIKHRLKQEKIKLKAIENLIKEIETDNKCKKPLENKSPIMRHVYIQYRNYKQSVEDWENLDKHLNKLISKLDKERQDILKKYSKDKDN